MTAARSLVLTVAVACVVQSKGLAGTPAFQGLGDLPGGPFYTVALAVSADGSTAVGGANIGLYTEAFLWNNGAITALGELPGGWVDSIALGVSADGSVVVGSGDSLAGTEALIWESGMMTRLGALPGGGSYGKAYDVSPDGAVVVGYSASWNGREAFRWENGVMTGLGDLPGGLFGSYAMEVSADGSVVVGAGTSYNGREALRWDNGAMTTLGALPGGSPFAGATAVSADGSVVVGFSSSDDSVWWEACRWANGAITQLGDRPGGYRQSAAFDVSGDGSVIVGSHTISLESPTEAFIWTADTGILKLSDILTALGLDLTGWHLLEAMGISDDGLSIVGHGWSVTNGHEGWIATLPADWIEQVSYALTVTIAKSALAEWGTVAVEPNLPAYAVGRTVTLTALPNGDNELKKWKLYDPNHPGDANHVVTDTNDVLTLVMMSDREVVAVFKCASGTPLLPALTLAALGLFVLIRRRA